MEAGREVMVVPGSILAEQSAGCHELIRQGATLVASVEQVVEALGEAAPGAEAPPPSAVAGPGGDDAAAAEATGADADPVLRALGHDPTTLDALMARCGWAAPALNAHLLTLELAGLVARLPGGLYQGLGTG